MKVLITSDFYNEFELIEVKNRLEAEKYINDCLSGDPGEVTILGSHFTLDTEEAKKQAELILFTSDF